MINDRNTCRVYGDNFTFIIFQNDTLSRFRRFKKIKKTENTKEMLQMKLSKEKAKPKGNELDSNREKT